MGSAAVKRRHVAVAAAGVALLLALLWWQPADTGVAAGTAPQAFGRVQPSAVADKPRPVFSAAPPRKRPAATVLQPDEVQVCGLGIVKPVNDDGDLVAPAHLQAARDALDRHLAEHADVKVRALGALLAPEGRRQEQARRRDELARAAAAGDDPALYAMAWAACQPDAEGQRPGACQLLSLRQWTRIDADNGVPWLKLAGEARSHTDSATEAEALYRASMASRFDAHWGLFPNLADQALPPDTPGWQRYQAMLQAAGVQAAVALPEMRAPLEHCSPQRLDANRRQVCEALAKALVDKGTTLWDHTMASALGRRLGWPAERLAALQRERDAMQGLALMHSPTLSLDCAGVERTRQWFADLFRHGELGAMRREMQRLGEKPEALARRYRAFAAELAASRAASAVHR
jgi:hypothetical protein